MWLVKRDNRNTALDSYRGLDHFLDDVWNNFLTSPQFREDDSVVWTPRMDIKETKDAFEISADLPGLKKEDVKISLKDGVLTISGERKYENEKKDQDKYYMERVYGNFSRSFSLPADVKDKEIKANLKNGVLTLSLPKAEKVKPKEIEIH
ncbi:MAG: Hsp20/alpha crystallin family protein [Calditrichaeota bacterium]|nr:Hsp20 family protein [Actinomycetota bacterium]NOY59923.1 Hsp20/alpha crystallin family protein [Calditrichota bacterium]